MKVMASPGSPLLWTLWSFSIFAASLQSDYFGTQFPSAGSGEEDLFQPVASNEMVPVGGTVTLTCRVKESDNSTLQWTNTAQQTLYFGEKRALRDNRIQLHRSTPTELSITISDVQLSDEGEYTCAIFTMPVRTARATITVLGVPGNPEISGYEDPVQEGETLTLTCSTARSKPPANIHWFRGNEKLEGQPDLVEEDPDDRTFRVSSKLELKVTQADNNAPVACVVEHPSLAPGNKRTEQRLNVQYVPVVHIRPESDLPREGEKFHLQCVGVGNPEPTSYEWEKKDGELPPLTKVDGSFLYFELLNKSDNGAYLCRANNGIGQGEGDYTLLVQGSLSSDFLFPTSHPATPDPTTLDPYPASSSETTPWPSSPRIPTPSSSSWSAVPSDTSPPAPASLPPASPSPSSNPMTVPTASTWPPSSSMSNALFPTVTVTVTPQPFSPPLSAATSTPSPAVSLTPTSVSIRLNGFYSFTDTADSAADPTAMSTSSSVDHAVIGGVVAVIVFILLCLLIVLGRYLIRHKGTYLTHEAKGSDDAPDADTAIINAEGGHSGADDKKEYFI